jgi:putative ABC transport system substrate-binding protein
LHCIHSKPLAQENAVKIFLLLSIYVFSSFFWSIDPCQGRPEKVWRLGVLFWHDSPNDLAALEGIKEALKETRRRVVYLKEEAGESPEKAIAILKKFKAEKVDLIYAMGTEAARYAAQEIKEIPIVFTAVTNPVETGLVASWEGSGTNLAGNSNWIASETLLNVFCLAVPNLSRLGILRSESTAVSAAELRGMKDHLSRKEAPAVTITEEVVKEAKEIPAAVDRLAGAGVQALWIPIDYDIYSNLGAVLDAAVPHKLPLVSSSLKATRAGAVAGVVVDYKMLGKRSVEIALKILEEGADPGKVPVGLMNGYQVFVNMGAARRLNYELPLSLLVVADAILTELPQ